jgi:hypothetical protein
MNIPEHIKESLDRYVQEKTPTGGFLRAVLANDLMGAFSKGDKESLEALKDIVSYIYNKLPGDCWGSYKVVNEWLMK